MSCEEDFSFVMESPLDETQKNIAKCKVQYNQLLLEHTDLARARDEQNNLAEQFRDRAVKLKKSLEEDESNQAREVDHEKRRLASLHEEESRLKGDINRIKEDLCHLDKSNHNLKQQTDVPVPEKRAVFTGVTGGTANSLDFDMIPRIVYPMEGGTALVTFEEEIVAQKILSMREHEVKLVENGECSITLEAKPVQLMMPSHVEMDTQVCPQRILVSNLPEKGEKDRLLDKLVIHFSKKKNGGGDVDEADMLHDSGNVVITFTESNVAKGLTDKQYHNVQFEKGKIHKVKATPFLNGEITSFKTRISECGRTLLLTGIPAIMEQDLLQDLLEIHFQKVSNGGGEVDIIIYNPLGHNTLALFEEDPMKAPVSEKTQP